MADPVRNRSGFLARPNDDPVKTLGIAILVAFFSAVTVSVTAVWLRPYQEANRKAELEARVERMLDTLPGMRHMMMEVGVDSLETRMVDLANGSFVSGADPAGFDAVAAARDPAASIELAPEADIAGIKRRANLSPVYLLQRHGRLMLIVLPVYGAGYQSTIRAYLALEHDLVTIAALTITEQGDTPGYGARIEEPEWQALWPGRKIADENGNIVIAVVRGQATTPYEVDGISGATYTSNGVMNMLRFWLGDLGFGPFLNRLEKEGL